MSEKISYNDPTDLAVDPTNPDILYLPTSGFGIGKTTNGGETWHYINTGINAAEVSLVGILAEPAGGLIVSGDFNVFRSYDLGQTWKKLNVGKQLTAQFDEIAIDPANSQRIWIATDQGGMYVSADGGDTFTNIFKVMPPSTGFRYGSIYAMAHAPALVAGQPDRLYAVKAGFSIWRSDDGGDKWIFLHHSEVDYTYTLAVDPKNPDVLFSGHNPKPFETEVRLFKTTDGGKTWDTPLTLDDASGLTSVAIYPSKTSNVYAGVTSDTGGRVYTSSNGGSKLKVIDGLSFANIHAMATHPSDPAYAIAALWGGGLYYTVDSGATWDEFLQPHTVSASAVMIPPANSTDPMFFYAADRSAPRIYKATGF